MLIHIVAHVAYSTWGGNLLQIDASASGKKKISSSVNSVDHQVVLALSGDACRPVSQSTAGIPVMSSRSFPSRARGACGTRLSLCHNTATTASVALVVSFFLQGLTLISYHSYTYIYCVRGSCCIILLQGLTRVCLCVCVSVCLCVCVWRTANISLPVWSFHATLFEFTSTATASRDR